MANIRNAQAASEALLKKAGEECCGCEKGKDPESLIGSAADVQVADNAPAGVTVPGEEGLEASGLTSEDKGTDVGHVDTNGPGVENNAEVDEIIATATEVKKTASALLDVAARIVALPDSAFAGVTKIASAECTDADVERYIVKRASEGDPTMQGILNYCAMMEKVAAGVPAEEVAAGAQIENEVAQAVDVVTQTLMSEEPELDETTARQIAEESVAQVLNEAAEGGAGEEVAQADEAAQLEGATQELVEELKQELVAKGVAEEEAEALAVEAAADMLRKAASAPEAVEEAVEAAPEAAAEEADADIDEEAVEAVTQIASAVKEADPSITDEEAVEGAIEVLTEAANNPEAFAEQAAVADGAEGAADDTGVEALAVDLVENLAQDIKASDPSISDDEARQGAAAAVADAFDTAITQQAVGAIDEAGAPVLDDAAAGQLVDDLKKSASAFPLRDALTAVVNHQLQLSPEVFAQRAAAHLSAK